MLKKVAMTGVGLENVYNQTLQRIREQRGDRSRLGMEVLMWVSHSKRPLRIDELRHALAADIESTDLDHENLPPQDTVLGSCLGLVVVDEETSTVRLIHYTLHKYLSQPGILPNAHKTLAQSCLTYLNFERVKGLPANQISVVRDMPFLEYSSLYWGSHAKIGLSDHAKSLALELLNRYSDHISATLLWDQIQIPHPDPHSHHLFSGLHYASYLGINALVHALIRRKGCDLNQVDCMGFTPLVWASWKGNQEAVGQLIIRSGIRLDKPGKDGRTPLHLASGEGHEGVVGQLLSGGCAGLNKTDKDGRTPLYHASSHGHEGVVRQLLSSYNIDPNLQNSDGQTPLCSASRNGHAEVVKLLLAKNSIRPNRSNNYGRTPLWWASSNGHEGVVRLLLARHDVDRNFTDHDGQTPLAAASMRGHMEIVALLQPRRFF